MGNKVIIVPSCQVYSVIYFILYKMSCFEKAVYLELHHKQVW